MIPDPTDRPAIRSPKNARLREVVALQDARARRRSGRFLLEGPKVIEEALERRPAWLELLVHRVDDDGRPDPRAAAALEAARARGVERLAVVASTFDRLAGTESPQPLLAVARQGWAELEELLGPRGEAAPRGLVALAGVQDPGNVGTILRTARFFGLGVVLLPGAGDPWSPKVVRASAGALLEAPPARAPSVEELLQRARAAGLEPVALDAHGGEDPRARPPPARALLLLGAEGPGLPRVEARRLTLAPREPTAESLNVAVAFGVVAALWAGRAAP